MMRDINNKHENNNIESGYPDYEEDMILCIDIPMPSSCLMDMGISIGGYSSFKLNEEV